MAVIVETGSIESSAKWDIEAVGAQMSFLQGEVLTIVEAAISGPQLNAVKDLVKRAFRDRQRYMRELSGVTLNHARQ